MRQDTKIGASLSFPHLFRQIGPSWLIYEDAKSLFCKQNVSCPRLRIKVWHVPCIWSHASLYDTSKAVFIQILLWGSLSFQWVGPLFFPDLAFRQFVISVSWSFLLVLIYSFKVVVLSRYQTYWSYAIQKGAKNLLAVLWNPGWGQLNTSNRITYFRKFYARLVTIEAIFFLRH